MREGAGPTHCAPSEIFFCGEIMTLSELLPTIQSLPRADKLRLIQLLAADIAREEGFAREVADKTVPIWSPHDSLAGAATLLRVLDEDKVAR